MTKVICNSFVKRQTAESPFSFFADMLPCPAYPDGRTAAWGSLEGHIEECVDEPEKLEASIKDGYKPGVKVVTIPGAAFGDHRFYSGVIALTAETLLIASFLPRREGEASFLEVVAKGAKAPAVVVDVILYTQAALEADASSIPADYEIVSINARLTLAPEPMHPVTMMRNFLKLPGGTALEFTDEIAKTMTREQWLEKTLTQFAVSIEFWSRHAMRAV